MLTSQFLVRHISLPKDAHRYRDGFQHRYAGKRSHEFVSGECATLLAWLQNDAGRERNPVTEQKVCRQLEAWRGDANP